MIKKFKFNGLYIYEDEKFLSRNVCEYNTDETPQLNTEYLHNEESLEDSLYDNISTTLENDLFEGVKLVEVKVTKCETNEYCEGETEYLDSPVGGYGDNIKWDGAYQWTDITEWPEMSCEGYIVIDDVDDKFEKNYDIHSFNIDLSLSSSCGEDDAEGVSQEFEDKYLKFELDNEEEKLTESLNENTLELSYPSILAEIEDLFDCFNNECEHIYGTNVVPMSIMAKPENIKKTEEFVNGCRERVKNLRKALKAMGMPVSILDMCSEINKQDYTIMKTDLLKRIYAFVKKQQKSSETMVESVVDKTPDELFLAKLRELTSDNYHYEARKMIADKYFGVGCSYSILLNACIDIVEKGVWQYEGVNETIFKVSIDMCNGMFKELEKKIGKDNVKLIRSCL
ncbi:MAG: hypothetical protein MJZ34_11265 [Paludibacteraceae bacterium]|nr:hypothetical protein [Paludibacteraceae bacterium]